MCKMPPSHHLHVDAAVENKKSELSSGRVCKLKFSQDPAR